MNIGLGEVTRIDSLRIIWPNNKTEVLSDIKVNQTLVLSQENAAETFNPKKPIQKNELLVEVPNTKLETHQENNYTDFDYEGMIYKKLSQEGPALAVADVNGDGNEDVFIGGAKDQSGLIYLNKGNGNLSITNQPALKNDLVFEDTSAAFFDADGDGDQDLMVGSGGMRLEKMKIINQDFI